MKFTHILLEMIKENGGYSLTRVQSAIGFLAFIIGSGYLIYNQMEWGNYDTFAIVTGGSSTATQIANKYINSKYNTKLGESGKPLASKSYGINGTNPRD